MTELLDFVRQATPTTTNGDISLGAAEAGYVTITDHPIVVNGTQIYLSVIDGEDIESGIYTWNTGNTLTRTSIIFTVVSGTYDDTTPVALTLSGNAVVVSVASLAAFDKPHAVNGAYIWNSSDISLFSVGFKTISWNSSDYDTKDYHDEAGGGGVDSKIIIPGGVKRARLAFHFLIGLSSGTISETEVVIYKDGATFFPQANAYGENSFDSNVRQVDGSTPVMDVVEGEEYEVLVRTVDSNGSASTFVDDDGLSWFSIEVIE